MADLDSLFAVDYFKGSMRLKGNFSFLKKVKRSVGHKIRK
jgi:hypothetical protein